MLIVTVGPAQQPCVSAMLGGLLSSQDSTQCHTTIGVVDYYCTSTPLSGSMRPNHVHFGTTYICTPTQASMLKTDCEAMG